MKKQLLEYIARIAELGKNDEIISAHARELHCYVDRLPEDSVSSSETNNNEEDTGGGDHPPKPPGQP